MANGDLPVETFRDAGDVFQTGLLRLRENGSVVPGIQLEPNYTVSGGALALKHGGFISGGVFFRANGTVERDLGQPNTSLVPLCECPAGVLFRNGEAYPTRRLALWTRNGFARWFRPPALDWSKPVTATPGEWGIIYLAANQLPSYSKSLLWHPSTRRLWVGGDFNIVAGQPRDGVARIKGGFSWW